MNEKERAYNKDIRRNKEFVTLYLGLAIGSGRYSGYLIGCGT